MKSIYNTALLVIFSGPAMYYGLKYTLLGAYRGLIQKRIPMGDDDNGAATGWVAVAIGIYSLLMAVGVIYAIAYLAYWLLWATP
jgi:hypothetical protein